MMDSAAQFYSRPSYSGGFNFPVYTGSRRQAGGNAVLGAVQRAVVPALKSTGKELGRQAVDMLADVAHDVLDGSKFKDSLKHRASQYAAKTAQRGLNTFVSSAANALVNGKAPVKRRAPSMGVASKRRRLTQGHSQSNRLGAQRRTTASRRMASMRPRTKIRIPRRRPIVGRHVTRQLRKVPKLNAGRAVTRQLGKQIPRLVTKQIGRQVPRLAGKLALKSLSKVNPLSLATKLF